MATVRITKARHQHGAMEWVGAAEIDRKSRIERSLDIPEAAYLHIEATIANGHIEGLFDLDDGTRYQWLLDR